MMKFKLNSPGSKLIGSLRIPASKSISNRLLIMQALSLESFLIHDLSESEDTRVMKEAFSSKEEIINIGHAGTAMRFLTAYFAIKEGERVLTGSERMKNRPVARLVDALRELGADIEYLEKEGFPPVRIKGKTLISDHVSVDGSISSQYISALLMIAPCLPSGLKLELRNTVISASYIRLTLKLMQQFGIQHRWEGNTISIEHQPYRPSDITVEPDWSAASYCYEMVALCEDADLFVQGLKPGSMQGDAVSESYFELLGVKTMYTKEGARLIKTCSATNYLELDFSDSPDIVQTMAVTCVMLDISFKFSGTQSLLIKETDRIAALQKELAKFGAHLHYDERGILSWTGPLKEHPRAGVEIETYQDHRMAMAFAPVALKSDTLLIHDPMVVIKSFPGFWEEMQKIGFVVESIT